LNIFFGRFPPIVRLILRGGMMNQGPCTSYIEHPEPEKLFQLRSKTDRQILNLIHSKLEIGLNIVALVQTTYSGGNRDHAEHLLKRAEQAVIEVKQLLPLLTEDQRRGFGPTLNNLQEASDHLSRNNVRSRSATASMF
jgi:hypothetical protein